MCRCRRDGLNQSFPFPSHFLKLVGFVVSHFQRWHRSSANKVAGNASKTSKCDYDLDDDAHNDGDHRDDFVGKICQ